MRRRSQPTRSTWPSMTCHAPTIEDYLKNIDQVTAEDVQRVASELLDPDRLLTVVVGKGSEVRESLSAFGTVMLYDEDGNRVEESGGAPPCALGR